MRKTLFISMIIFPLLLTMFNGCAKQGNDPRPLVITTLFPQYDFARQIAGDKINLKLLLKPGVEAHAFEPTPRDIAEISKASLFVYTGEFMEPWAERILKGIKNENLIIVDAGKNITLLDGDGHPDEHAGDGDDHGHKDKLSHDQKKQDQQKKHNHRDKDPHIWTDPLNVLKIIDNILEGLVKADPENRAFYTANADKYKKEILALHSDFINTFKKTEHKKILYAGHFAFGYFARRYGLEHISPYKGFSPNSEPGPKEIAELIKSIEESKTKVIYYEELVDPKVARVISQQTEAEMVLLHGAHNVSKKDFDEGLTYIAVMKNNLEALKKGLGYKE